jgi:hypothetical protein
MIKAPHFVKPIKEVSCQIPLIKHDKGTTFCQTYQGGELPNTPHQGFFYFAEELNKVLYRAALLGPKRALESAQQVFGVLHQGACLPLKRV